MLNVSIVVYHPDWVGEVIPLVSELLRIQWVKKVYLIDNSETQGANNLPAEWGCIVARQEGGMVVDDGQGTMEQGRWSKDDGIRTKDEGRMAKDGSRVEYVFMGENAGYGKAHNVALRESVYDKVPYHLVLNADISLNAEEIDSLCRFMDAQPSVGQLMPKVVYPNGETQYLCKLLPTPIDVFGRRFLPKRIIARRNARYELRASGYNRPMNVPYLSGCFMLLRTEAALKAGLVDERYFGYPEDMDLTRRIHRDYLTLYYPAIQIVHNKKKGSYHSMRLLWIHIVNMCKYFNKWGWWYDPERRAFNRQLLDELGIN